ncbi:MAG: hypothetical protein ABI980_07260, partial [Nitrospirota bacterium]
MGGPALSSAVGVAEAKPVRKIHGAEAIDNRRIISMASCFPWFSAAREDLEGCQSSPTIQSWTGFVASRIIEVYDRSPAKFLLS